jgi:hypothetical protein
VTTNLTKTWRLCLGALASACGLATFGCQHTPIDLSKGPAPLRMPRPDTEPAQTYEDSLTGGEIFSMYCNQCHNARALAERPFASYQNVAAHMRVRANLTGKEYEKLLTFLRRWHDVPSPVPDPEPSPKRLIYSQPIAELREQAPAAPAAAPAAPQPQPVAVPVPVPNPAPPNPPQALNPAQAPGPALAGPG